MIISSQRYTDPGIVAQKVADRDFTISVALLHHSDFPGEYFGLVIDGHHSLCASKEEGVDFVVVDAGNAYQQELDHLGLEAFLEAYHLGDDYYDIATNINIF